MRTILATATAATAAILTLSLTACNNTDNTASAPPSTTSSAAPAKTTPSTPGRHDTTPSSQDAQPTEPGAAEGQLTYLAPGKFQVGDTVFFTATDTVLIVAGGKCPDGAARPNNRCTTDNMEMWVQSAPRFAQVTFSGQTATTIREVNDI